MQPEEYFQIIAAQHLAEGHHYRFPVDSVWFKTLIAAESRGIEDHFGIIFKSVEFEDLFFYFLVEFLFEEDVATGCAAFQDGAVIPEFSGKEFCLNLGSRNHQIAFCGVIFSRTDILETECFAGICFYTFHCNSSVPGLDIFLTFALAPLEAHRVGSGIGEYEFGAVDILVIVPGAQSDALDSAVHGGRVEMLAENPNYLIFGTMVQQIFRNVSGVAGILAEMVGPAHYTPFLDRNEQLETAGKCIGEAVLETVYTPGQSVSKISKRHIYKNQVLHLQNINRLVGKDMQLFFTFANWRSIYDKSYHIRHL